MAKIIARGNYGGSEILIHDSLEDERAGQIAKNLNDASCYDENDDNTYVVVPDDYVVVE